MPGNGAVYAVKRRKKPVQKIPRPPPVKTNPSKRHRDRLNSELDSLTDMLPFSSEVRGRLDKLSVLRLSVGYLKAKSFFHAALQKRSSPLVSTNGRNGQSTSLDGVTFSEGELLLQALNGFVLVVTTDGTVFYTSPTIQDFLGFHQSDVVHQSVYDLVHTDDREMFRCQLHFALNPTDSRTDTRADDSRCAQYVPPENSPFLERSFCCRFRCLLDNSSGFMALNFTGRLKYLNLPGCSGADGGLGALPAPQLALFSIGTPVLPPSVMEIRTKTFIFQTKHRMDFAPLGIDTRGKLVLGYSEIELVTTGSGYQFIHAADMMYCADNHLRMMKTGDSGFTFFRLLTKTGGWLWVQASARIVLKDGRPDFIIARQKALTNEEGEEHLQQRRQQLPFNLATGEGVLYDLSLDAFSIPGNMPDPNAPGPPPHSPPTPLTTPEKPLDPASLLGSLRRQDHSVYAQKPDTQIPVFDQLQDFDFEEPQPQKSRTPIPVFNHIEDFDLEEPQPSSLEQAFTDSRALLSVPGQIRDSQKRSLSRVDLTSDAMMDSLEQILGDIGDGIDIEGLEVDDSELKEWENALVRVNNQREEVSEDFNRMLANDVFLYVEEALRWEFGGSVEGSNQTGKHQEFTVSHNERQWQPTTDDGKSGHSERILGCLSSSGLKGSAEVVKTPGKCRKTCQEHSASLPGTSSNRHSHQQQQCGKRKMTTQSAHIDLTTQQQSWLPSVPNTTNITHQPGSKLMDNCVQYTLNHPISQQTHMQNSLVWQQQEQLPQTGFQHRAHTHTQSARTHTPGGANSTVSHPHTRTHMHAHTNTHTLTQTQRLAGSCMYEKREGHIPSAATVVPMPQNGPFLATGRPTHPDAFTPSHPNNMAAEHGSIQTAFYCWNGDSQIPKAPLNGAVDPFAFPTLPTGSINLSQK